MYWHKGMVSISSRPSSGRLQGPHARLPGAAEPHSKLRQGPAQAAAPSQEQSKRKRKK